METTGNGGSAKPREPHKSQCEPACGAVPGVSGLLAEPAFKLQRLPSLPVRTSSASIDTGASKADTTARKLSQAARRAHTLSAGRDDENGVTKKL